MAVIEWVLTHLSGTNHFAFLLSYNHHAIPKVGTIPSPQFYTGENWAWGRMKKLTRKLSRSPLSPLEGNLALYKVPLIPFDPAIPLQGFDPQKEPHKYTKIYGQRHLWQLCLWDTENNMDGELVRCIMVYSHNAIESLNMMLQKNI